MHDYVRVFIVNANANYVGDQLHKNDFFSVDDPLLYLV